MAIDPPSYGPSWSNRTLSHQLVAFTLAVVLPVLSSILTRDSAVLLTIPFSLYFMSIAVVSTLGGLAPGLLAVVFCVISRNYFITPGEQLLAINTTGIYRVAVLIADAVLVSSLDRRGRIASDRLRRALRDLHHRNDAFIESLHNNKCASWVHDVSGEKGPQFHPGSYAIYGRPFCDFDSTSHLTALHPEDHARTRDLMERMKSEAVPVHSEFRSVWPNGEVHSLEMRATRVPGKRPVWRGLTVDITERRLAEAAILRSEKLAAMGRLASTVAHEINNPLESVTNLLYLARADQELSSDTRTYLATAEQELARLGDITRLTLGFVRTSATRPSMPAEEVIEDVLKIFRQRLESKQVKVERRFEPGVEVHIAAHELRQIVTNLVSNAVDAMSKPGGRLRVSIAREETAIAIAIEDDGSGIAPSQLQRIFDPFFTTKEDVGTGIGLWVTRELVETNGGQIQAESGDLANGMKTRFRVELPIPTGVETMSQRAGATQGLHQAGR